MDRFLMFTIPFVMGFIFRAMIYQIEGYFYTRKIIKHLEDLGVKLEEGDD